MTETKDRSGEAAGTESGYASILDVSPDYILRYDGQGRHLYANPAALSVMGKTSGELVGKSHRELGYEAELCGLWEEAIGEVYKGGRDRTIEFDFPTPMGTRRLELLLRPERGEDGVVASVLGFGRDIGRRSKIDATLHFLVESGWPATGEDFFESLAVWLARTLDMDYICIDRLEGENAEATTVAVWFDGTIRENIRYALRDTPCGVAVGKTICCFPEGAHRLFPRDIALQDMKAESYVGTTLRNSRGRDIGLIAIIGRRPLANREEAEAILKLVSIRAAGELERREVEAAVARASKEKEILHRELQHRVKNSFAMIVSLIQLEGLDKGERDPRVAEALADIERRVFVLSRLYSLLYEEGSTAISVEQLFTSICSSLAEAFADGRLDDISADIEPLTLEAGRAASLGLALNELLTNALKYAFPPGSCGSIRVSLRREGELWRLRVEDDGVGLPEGFSLADSGGFGFTLVRGLAEELGGHFERLGDRGASFALSFPAL